MKKSRVCPAFLCGCRGPNPELPDAAIDEAVAKLTFAKLLDLAAGLDDEQRRAIELGLTEDQLALFDLLGRESLSAADREKIKQESRDLLAELQRLIAPLEQWTEKEQTQAEVEVFILDHVYQALPEPPYTPDDKKEVAALVYRHVWQQSAKGSLAAK